MRRSLAPSVTYYISIHRERSVNFSDSIRGRRGLAEFLTFATCVAAAAAAAVVH